MRHAFSLGLVVLLTAFPALAEVTEAQASKLALQMIEKHHLSGLSAECALLLTEDDSWQFSVHGMDTEGCGGGDPDTAPRLFNMLVDRKTGIVQTEVWKEGDDAPSFRPLK